MADEVPRQPEGGAPDGGGAAASHEAAGHAAAKADPAAHAEVGRDAAAKPMAPRGRDQRLDGRSLLLIAVTALGFLGAGLLLDRLPMLAEARAILRGHSGFAAFPDPGGGGGGIFELVARRLGSGGPFALPVGEMPSSVVLDAADRGGRLPVVSIVADEDHLWDPEMGILANARRSGRLWERPAWVSLFEDGEPVLGSRVGLRVHGDSSRYRDPVSLRLHFDPRYGASSRDGGRLIGARSGPASAVVLRRSWPRGLYPQLFAFEVGRRVGSIVPDFRAARVFLNGEDRGVHVLSERVRQDGWGLSHFGHHDFNMWVWKAEIEPRGLEAFTELEDWVEAQEHLTLEQAAERVDVDNVTRHLFTDMFCSTTDWAQGAVAVDRRDPDARWLFVHWDMDQSFQSLGVAEVAPWEMPVMELITLELPLQRLKELFVITDDAHFRWHEGDVRRHLFLRLLEDPAYVEHFLRFVTETLNHRLTPHFFADLLDRYAVLRQDDGTFGGHRLDAFFERRPDVVRREVARYFGLEGPVEVVLDSPADVDWRIDGHPESGPYRGLYFIGQTVRIEANGEGSRQVSHWLIDGERIERATLELEVSAATRVVPVFTPR